MRGYPRKPGIGGNREAVLAVYPKAILVKREGKYYICNGATLLQSGETPDLAWMAAAERFARRRKESGK